METEAPRGTDRDTESETWRETNRDPEGQGKRQCHGKECKERGNRDRYTEQDTEMMEP